MDLEEAMTATQASKRAVETPLDLVNIKVMQHGSSQRWINIPQSQRSDGQSFVFVSPQIRRESAVKSPPPPILVEGLKLNNV